MFPKLSMNASQCSIFLVMHVQIRRGGSLGAWNLVSCYCIEICPNSDNYPLYLKLHDIFYLIYNFHDPAMYSEL